MKNLSKKIDEELQVYLPDDYFEDLRAKLIPRLVRLFESEQSHIQVVMQAEGSDGAEGAAVGQRSVGTATCGVDDNGWQCQKTTEPGGVASQCMNGCVLAGSSCEG